MFYAIFFSYPLYCLIICMIKQKERWTCHCRTGQELGDNGLSSLLHHGQVTWSWGAEYPVWGIDSLQAPLEPTVLYRDLRGLQRHLELGWMQPTGWMLRREEGGNRCPPTTVMDGKESAVWGQRGRGIWVCFFFKCISFCQKDWWICSWGKWIQVTIDMWISG